MEITTIGLDLAKSVFQLHAVDAHGTVVWRKKLRRSALLGRDGRIVWAVLARGEAYRSPAAA